ncbi:MAG: hypothetical protein MUF21_03295 [Gemmatimonadaceae bacterium]|nr:hypothetical protein [Gemmatimonadaceae bacterium]
MPVHAVGPPGTQRAPLLAVRAVLRAVVRDPALPIVVRSAAPIEAAALVRAWVADVAAARPVEVVASDGCALVARRAPGPHAPILVVAPGAAIARLRPPHARGWCRLDLPARLPPVERRGDATTFGA